MPQGRIDLHTHSRHSDGVLSPTALVAEAVRGGVAVLSLTDHDNVDGLDEARTACAAAGIRLVPGVEISTHADGVDFHILGYFIDDRHPALRTLLTRLMELRRSRILEILEALEKEKGIRLSAEEVFREAEGCSIGRPHVARVLVRHGHAATVSQAFRKFLGPRAAAYKKAHDLAPADGIRAIRDAGGIASLAHPGFIEDDAKIPPLVAHGLRAIEAYHSHPSGDVSKRYLELAAKLGLLATAGSDFHVPDGTSTPVGSISLPWEQFENLENAKR